MKKLSRVVKEESIGISIKYRVRERGCLARRPLLGGTAEKNINYRKLRTLGRTRISILIYIVKFHINFLEKRM